MDSKKILEACATIIAALAALKLLETEAAYLLGFLRLQVHDLAGAEDRLAREITDKMEAERAHLLRTNEALQKLAGELGTTPEALAKTISKNAKVQLEGQQLGAKQGELA